METSMGLLSHGIFWTAGMILLAGGFVACNVLSSPATPSLPLATPSAPSSTTLMPLQGGGPVAPSWARITAQVLQVTPGDKVAGSEVVTVLSLQILTVERVEGSAPVTVGQVAQVWVKGEIAVERVGTILSAVVRAAGDEHGLRLWLSDLQWK